MKYTHTHTHTNIYIYIYIYIYKQNMFHFRSDVLKYIKNLINTNRHPHTPKEV